MDFTFNSNQSIKFKPTNEGIELLKAKHDALNTQIKLNGGKGLGEYQPNLDVDGYMVMQFWTFMQTFGPTVNLSKPSLFDLDIVFLSGKPVENSHD